VDNKLVSKPDGKGFRNASGPVQLQLPKDLSSRPARVESNGNFVEFALKGATKPADLQPAASAMAQEGSHVSLAELWPLVVSAPSGLVRLSPISAGSRMSEVNAMSQWEKVYDTTNS
jgi:hypothetical protein